MGNHGSWIWLSGGHPDTGSNEHKALSPPLSPGPIWKMQGLDQMATRAFQFEYSTASTEREAQTLFPSCSRPLCLCTCSERGGKMSDVKEKGFS